MTGWISEGLRTDFGRIFDICILGEIDFGCILNAFACVFWMDFGLILDGFRTFFGRILADFGRFFFTDRKRDEFWTYIGRDGFWTVWIIDGFWTD